MKTMLYQLYKPEFFFITARSASIFVSSTAVHINDFHIFTVRVQSCFNKTIVWEKETEVPNLYSVKSYPNIRIWQAKHAQQGLHSFTVRTTEADHTCKNQKGYKKNKQTSDDKVWGSVVDSKPNSPNQHHKDCLADSKENYHIDKLKKKLWELQINLNSMFKKLTYHRITNTKEVWI